MRRCWGLAIVVFGHETEAKKQHIEPIETTLVIEDVAFQGEGLARHDGDLVFVPYTIPGETVKATISRRTGRYYEADVDEVLTPSPHRVSPECPYVGDCTGCQWQHIDYGHQLEIKSRLVKEQLVRTGGFEDPPMGPVVGCDDPWHYRNTRGSPSAPAASSGSSTRRRDGSCASIVA